MKKDVLVLIVIPILIMWVCFILFEARLVVGDLSPYKRAEAAV